MTDLRAEETVGQDGEGLGVARGPEVVDRGGSLRIAQEASF